MRLQDHIYYSRGKWVVNLEYDNVQRTSYHNKGIEAVEALVKYCNGMEISFEPVSDQWIKWYEDMDRHYQYMESIKPNPSDKHAMGKWDMAYICDSPNPPGYFRANND